MTYSQDEFSRIKKIPEELFKPSTLSIPLRFRTSPVNPVHVGYATPAFPVDTHVFRVTKWLSWIPEKATREQAHVILEALVPLDLHYPLHLNLIARARDMQSGADRDVGSARSSASVLVTSKYKDPLHETLVGARSSCVVESCHGNE